MKNIKVIEKSSKFIPDERYSYRNLQDCFKGMEKRKLISKATYSILHHPLLSLAKTYNIKADGRYQHITLNSDHIIMLAYIMGYITDKLGSEYFWGSNQTIAKDLGISTRTVQRRLHTLKDIGFIEVDIEAKYERSVYVNYTIILSEILKTADTHFDPKLVSEACAFVAQFFIKENWVEGFKLNETSLKLFNHYLEKAATKEIPDTFDFIFDTMLQFAKLDPDAYSDKRLELRREYIKTCVNT